MPHAAGLQAVRAVLARLNPAAVLGPGDVLQPAGRLAAGEALQPGQGLQGQALGVDERVEELSYWFWGVVCPECRVAIGDDVVVLRVARPVLKPVT
jgi:hypothetical protein